MGNGTRDPSKVGVVVMCQGSHRHDLNRDRDDHDPDRRLQLSFHDASLPSELWLNSENRGWDGH
jgi:hypothetical protein